MSRVFAYCSVPHKGQSIDDQVQQIAAAGFDVPQHHTIKEIISGGVVSCERRVFNKLMNDLRGGDALVVTRLDRLGRNTMDVLRTVEELSLMNVKVHCLALGAVDLTSPDGKTIMAVIAAVAEFERDLLVERTQAGLAHAKATGKALGRPRALTSDQEAHAIHQLSSGATISAVARGLNTSRATIMRLRVAKSL
jgi:putative DNA-invertase from lambdoid prophage Rac